MLKAAAAERLARRARARCSRAADRHPPRRRRHRRSPTTRRTRRAGCAATNHDCCDPRDHARGDVPDAPALDLSERGRGPNGAPSRLDRRLFMRLTSFTGCADVRPLADALEAASIAGVLYEDVTDPRGLALLTFAEDPGYFLDDVAGVLRGPAFRDLMLRPQLSMLGRSYSIGYESDLEDTLIHRPIARVLDPSLPWVVWYPLRRTGRLRAAPLRRAARAAGRAREPGPHVRGGRVRAGHPPRLPRPRHQRQRLRRRPARPQAPSAERARAADARHAAHRALSRPHRPVLRGPRGLAVHRAVSIPGHDSEHHPEHHTEHRRAHRRAVPPRVPARARRAHARVAHAAGRPLHARVPRGARRSTRSSSSARDPSWPPR